MVGRIQFDGAAGTVTPSTSVGSRADLAVSPVRTDAELPERAVTPGAKPQDVPPELQHHQTALDRIRDANHAVHESEEQARRLAEIEAKLVLGGERLREAEGADPASLEDAEAALAEFEAMTGKKKDKAQVEAPPLPGAKREKDPAETRRSERSDEPDVTVRKAKVLRRIQEALSRIGTIRTKVTGDTDRHYENLLTLNSSVSGLNFARTQLADTTFAVASAAGTVDAILVGVKTAVVAHGKISPDLVRLVL